MLRAWWCIHLVSRVNAHSSTPENLPTKAKRMHTGTYMHLGENEYMILPTPLPLSFKVSFSFMSNAYTWSHIYIYTFTHLYVYTCTNTFTQFISALCVRPVWLVLLSRHVALFHIWYMYITYTNVDAYVI